MTRRDILEKLALLMRTAFDDATLAPTMRTTSDDVAEWDSANHVLLMVAVEAEFGVRFESEEITAPQDVGRPRRPDREQAQVTRPLNALVMGGCLLRRPLRAVPFLAEKLTTNHGLNVMHSVAEMIQAVQFLKGNMEIPAEIRPLTGVAKLLSMPDGGDLEDLDLVLVEPGSPVDITFRGFAINRTRISDQVIKPIEAAAPKACKLTQKWLRQGLMEMNEDARRELSGQLLEFVPDDEMADYRRAVIAETRAMQSDVISGLQQLQSLTKRPIGVVIFVFRYMPDGRPVSWPKGSREGAIAAARALDLPYFEPTSLVQEHGVSNALEPDQRHYTQAFLPVIGEAIMEFAERVRARAKDSV